MAPDARTQARPPRVSALPRVHRPALAPTPLEHLRIGKVDVRTDNVYDPSPGAPLASLRRLANRLHVRTRPGTVRNELLFQPGDPWSTRTAEETARNLRNLDFLVPTGIAARREADSVVVDVETRDLWTTSPELDLQTVGGTRTGAWGFSERNLLGFGKSIIVLYRQDPTTVTRSIEYDDPNIHATHVRLSGGLGRSAEGFSRHAAVWRPFYAEETPQSWTLSAAEQTSIAHLY
ncbi:MAG TPA: hypothetical protein VMS88_04810, partial [Terriglobales bacterium]|nr:hypothetical protein [Terriglobales bacterium]